MPAVTGLLFDKDGTLFDFRATWGGWTARLIKELAEGDDDLAARLYKILGYIPQSQDFQPDSPVIAQTVAEIRDRLLPELPGWDGEILLERMNELAVQNTMVEAVPLAPLFAAFKRAGLKIGLATNDAEAPARAHLERAGIATDFDFVAGFDSGWGGKPATGQMQAFLRQTGLRAENVAMVGDSLHDLEAGRAAGMRRVAVLSGIASGSDLAPHADVVLADIGALVEWVATQANSQQAD
ncbi:MAG: HAD family hydrolase [Albidovulum sp.]